MSVSKFKFVSPGVFINEVDNSQRTKTPGDVGPVIIGRSERGPSRPTVIDSFSDFIEVFGNPIPGGQGGDVWREGNYTAPTYAAYAAQAWLKKSSPITFVRLLGEEHADASAAGGYAGWESETAYGLFVGNTGDTGSGGDMGSASLAAVVYLAEGASASLIGTAFDDTDVNGTEAIVKSEGDDFEFKMAVVDGDNYAFTSSFNFDRDSAKYIRNVFNTNPTLSNEGITRTDNVIPYWVGETFERGLKDILGDSTGADEQYAVLLPLAEEAVGAWDAANCRFGTRNARSGWVVSQVVSQDIGLETGSFDTTALPKLFRFVALDTGEWEQKNLKISITNIKPSTNDSNPYGSFSVEIRRAKDSDNRPQIVERFTSCNLNPSSDNYIAKKIGDRYQVWDYVENEYTEYGNYNNQSKFFRVEMNDDIEAGSIDPQLVPFGFYGPPKMDDVDFASGSAPDADTFLGGVDDIYTGVDDFTCSFAYPEIPLRESSSLGDLSSPKKAYWGINTGRYGDYTRFEESYADLVRYNGVDFSENSASFIFTLDDIEWVSGSQTNAVYNPGSRVAGTSITAGQSYDSSEAVVEGDVDYENVITAEFNRFTLPLFGGFDGLDITEKEPFRNNQWDVSASETNNYAYNSVKRALNSLADPEVVEFNMLAMPGIMEDSLISHAVRICEDRADALCIVDLDSDYRANTENALSPAGVRGSVATIVDTAQTLNLNSSYACAYYPWVQIKDTINGNILWVPPSVPALGAIASSEEQTELWFAPAGFTRGGLSGGAAGLPVLNVAHHLKQKDRDLLYEANINPIGRFPAEGIVILGQKTLTTVPTALDRINVRRLMIYLKREMSRIAATTLFEPNVQATWQGFLSRAEPLLNSVRSRYGLDAFKIVLDETTTTPDLIDRNIMYAKLFLKPTKAIEFIALDFVIMNSGAGFED